MSWAGLVTAIIASATALTIGLWVYPRQRELDRRHELQRERRVLYRDFARAYSKITSGEPATLDEISDARYAFDASISALLVSAPDDVAEAALQLRFAVDQYFSAEEMDDGFVLRGAVEECYRACLWAMRQESLNGTEITRELFTKEGKRRLPVRIKP